MKGRIVVLVVVCFAVLALALAPARAQQQQPVGKGQGHVVITTSEAGGEEGAKTFSRTFVFPSGKGGAAGAWSFGVGGLPGGGPNVPPYWIGVVCFPLNDAMRAQLDVPKGEGLLVASVMPKSPGDKAGIQLHDVLLKAGNKKLANVKELLDAVRGAKGGKAVTIELLRKGKKQTVKVQLAKRPEEGAHALPKVMAQVIGDAANVRTFPAMRPFPKDLEVTIAKKGPQPAKIAVKQGNEKWEVTEATLNKLPKEVRHHVTSWLRSTAWRPAFDIDLDLKKIEPMQVRVHQLWPHGGPKAQVQPLQQLMKSQEKSAARRLEEVERRLEELQKAFEALEKKK